MGNTTSADGLAGSRLYSPLSRDLRQFRLVVIQPGRGQKVCCDLEALRFDAHDRPGYETISYCWGDANRRDTIEVNGVEMSVPSSSACALKCVRLEEAKRTVWIDAICIDQSNIDERNYQVSMMGDIYANGSCNLVYFGQEKLKISYLARFKVALSNEIVPQKLEVLQNSRSPEGKLLYSTVDTLGEWGKVYDGLKGLFAKDWFWRVWTLQEAVLAKRNICFIGSQTLDLLDLTRAAAILTYNNHFNPREIASKCEAIGNLNYELDPVYGRRNYKEAGSLDLGHLLDLTRSRGCLNEQDKIFGVLGMIKNSSVTPDYRKEVAEVFREATIDIIRGRMDLSILGSVWRSKSRRDSLAALPSWVPDWTQQWDRSKHAYQLHESFDACQGKAHEPNFTSTLNVLEARGIEIGCIAGLTEIFGNEKGLKKAEAASLHKEAVLLLSNLGRERFDENVRLLAATTICAGVDYLDRRQDKSPKLAPPGFIPFMDGVKFRLGVDPSRIDQIPDLVEHRRLAGQYLDAVSRACTHRKFFVTPEGLAGLAPERTRQGDIVAVMFGLKWPAILRPTNEENYIFLGLAYVQGMMDGQAISDCEASSRSDKILKII